MWAPIFPLKIRVSDFLLQDEKNLWGELFVESEGINKSLKVVESESMVVSKIFELYS